MSQVQLSRRQLLKILVAAAGAAALASAPNKWKTPVVEVGALPAHAQTSNSYDFSPQQKSPGSGQ
jgi:hypothetical protein